ncbi:hypothetical protein ES332_D11G298600v1 [Gossypium tomentosum]|uniref:DC1 domain-containing protein n=1 Tax=Gossypium tomentosum TaxID=34277 RepID=A0A5D2IVL8_GOSTO|nr:hypothetical protein ES332_D11G298600v1 [Gossypium tomentosum]
MEFQHFAHHHKLSFREAYKEDGCVGSLDFINCPAYICEDDGFSMHKVCVEMLPQIQKDVFHPHPLKFKLLDIIVCDACRRLSACYISYRCMYCEFNLDFKCVINDENEIAKRADEDLQRTTSLHFSHQHQLTRCKVSQMTKIEEEKKVWKSSKLKCMACKQELQGTLTFICLSCKFFIHKSCMNDMPMQVQSSPIHPYHILHPRPFFKTQGLVRCYACRKKVNGFSFYCNKCNVDLHHSCHPHNLLQLGKSIIKGLSCDAYGRENCNDSLFSCRKCGFGSHPKCMPLPSSFAHKRHLHPFALVGPLAEDDSEDYYCDMCEIKINPEIHVYYCAECNYIVHIDCVLFEILRVSFHPHLLVLNDDDDEIIFRCDKCEELCIGSRYNYKLCSFNLDSKCGTSKYETPKSRNIITIVNHFSHLHQITRCKIDILQIEPDFYMTCMACRQCLYGIIYAFYYCSTFFLHESCLKHMSMEVQSLFHPQHPLTIITLAMESRCKACSEVVKGLVFGCVACGSVMHYSCAKYQFREIKHNCHIDHHLLHLGKGFFGDKSLQCHEWGQACKDTLFSCINTNVLHPLVLTTLVIEDDYEEYYCDTCEAKRNPEHDIYYYNECNYISYIDCVLSDVEPPEEIL